MHELVGVGGVDAIGRRCRLLIWPFFSSFFFLSFSLCLCPLLHPSTIITTSLISRFFSYALSSFFSSKVRHEAFIIRHYAEDVLYTIGNFTTKNDNTIPKDLTNTMLNSSASSLLKTLVKPMVNKKNGKSGHGISGGSGGSGGGGAGVGGGGDSGGSSGGSVGRRGGAAAATTTTKTVAGDFARSMELLTEELGASMCSYVRCVKPNASMKVKLVLLFLLLSSRKLS
jgi:myosin heavy subunit